MPSEGGQPRQLTFYQGSAQPLNDRMGIHNEVITWTPDSKRIVFLSRRDASNGWTKRQFTVSIDGGLPEPLPMDQGGLTSFNADGTKVAYNRIFRNFRTWKRYTGGLAQDIYIYDIKNNVFEQKIPHTDYTDTFPMWHGNTMYFTSDRGSEHRLNIYCLRSGFEAGGATHALHRFRRDVAESGRCIDHFRERRLSLCVGSGAPAQPTKLTITLPGERDLAMKHWTSVSKLITDLDIAPDGKRAVICRARQRLHRSRQGRRYPQPDSHSRASAKKELRWSPDGRWIAFVSDRTGEDEIYITPQDGMGNVELGKEPTRIKTKTKIKIKTRTKTRSRRQRSGQRKRTRQRQRAANHQRLQGIQVPSRLVARQQETGLGRQRPSPLVHRHRRQKAGRSGSRQVFRDQQLLLVARQQMDRVRQAAADRTQRRLSLLDCRQENHRGDRRPGQQPGAVFDPEGNYLYFLSDRDYNEVLGNYDFEFANPKTTRPYLVTLHADAPSPFPALSDETAIKRDDEPAPAAAGPTEKDQAKESGDKKKSQNTEERRRKGRRERSREGSQRGRQELPH